MESHWLCSGLPASEFGGGKNMNAMRNGGLHRFFHFTSQPSALAVNTIDARKHRAANRQHSTNLSSCLRYDLTRALHVWAMIKRRKFYFSLQSWLVAIISFLALSLSSSPQTQLLCHSLCLCWSPASSGFNE